MTAKQSKADSLYRAFCARVASADLDPGPGDDTPFVAPQLEDLPPVVQRYLRFMEVIDRPRVWSFQARFEGRFRMKPSASWMPAEAWQYNTRLGVARFFTMRLRAAGVVPMTGHDTYVRGEGRMVGKLLGVVTVASGSGPEFDIGELTTYLNDAVLFAPSMLLGPATSWKDIDDHRFEVSLTDEDRTVSATVDVDDDGRVVDFSSTDRYIASRHGATRARWRTPIPGWARIGGRPFPEPGRAVWELPDGPFTYVEGGVVASSVRYNVAPPVAP